MPTREIPRKEWVEFFNNFSRNHKGWTVNMEVFGTEIGAQLEAHEMPLEGVIADLKVTGRDQIAILIEESPQKHLVHSINHPEHVRVEKEESNSEMVIQIQAEDGFTTLLRFCCKAFPKAATGGL
jgi:hypothetical protein